MKIFPRRRPQLCAISHSLAPRWAGPFKILRQIADHSYELELPDNISANFSHTFHASVLKPWHFRDPANSQLEVSEPVLPNLQDEALQILAYPDDSDILAQDPEYASLGPHDASASSSSSAAPQVNANVNPIPNLPPVDPALALSYSPPVELPVPDLPDPNEPVTYPQNEATSYMSHSGRVLAQPPHARPRPPTPPAPPFPPEWLDARGIPLPVIPHPHVNMIHVFDSNEDVMLDPKIFASAKKTLRFKPSCDLFASASHHQLPRYFAPTSDALAAGKDAFSICWQQEATPYINPPWSLIPDVLKKIQTDRVKCMFVCPK